jgi:glycosyltransferase involved in cell wall biosynthesis
MVVANPFNIPFDSSVTYPGLSSECYQVACVARLELHAKGQDALLEVLADQKWKQRNMMVNLYGDGIDRQNIERLITYFSVKENVKLAGYINPLEIWNQNHALILPSRYEGLPLALVEAMLCGRASIVTNVGGNGEVVVDGVSGFIAAAPRAVYLDEALERAWLRRTEWEAIGHKAQQHIKTIIPEDPAKIFSDLISSFESDPAL